MRSSYCTIPRLGIAGLTLALAAGMVGCDDGITDPTAAEAEEAFSAALDGETLSVLRFEVVNSGITVTGVTEGDSIFVDGVRRVSGSSVEDAENHLDELQVEIAAEGDELVIRTIQPQDSRGRNYEVDYEVTVPARYTVYVEAANAAVAVSSIESLVSIAAANAAVTMDNIVGSVIIDLANGGVECEVMLPDLGAIDIALGNGAIDLRIPDSTSAELSASVGNGSISTMNLVIQDEVITETTLTGTLGGGTGTITLTVGNGVIALIGFAVT
jgi:hypothetical protein